MSEREDFDSSRCRFSTCGKLVGNENLNGYLIDYLPKKEQNQAINHKPEIMNFNQTSATERAKRDLAERLGISEGEIKEVSVRESDFPDMSLGAPVGDEMSAQMISSGWNIKLEADGKDYEYRADKYQLRLSDFEGTNHIIES